MCKKPSLAPKMIEWHLLFMTKKMQNGLVIIWSDELQSCPLSDAPKRCIRRSDERYRPNCIQKNWSMRADEELCGELLLLWVLANWYGVLSQLMRECCTLNYKKGFCQVFGNDKTSYFNRTMHLHTRLTKKWLAGHSSDPAKALIYIKLRILCLLFLVHCQGKLLEIKKSYHSSKWV